MLPKAFEYKRAASVADAIALMAQHGDDAKLMAGGQSLIPAMKLRLNSPDVVIDLSRIAELNYIKEQDGHICIGANATHSDIAYSDLIKSKLPLYADTAELIGDTQVRNRGTLGGSIAHADPSADWPAALLASGAVVVAQGANGTRMIDADDFFTGFFETALVEGEIVTEIRVPTPAAGTGMSYQKFMQPASRFAIVGCAAVVNGNNVRVAFTGLSDGPFRDTAVENAMSGMAHTAENIAAAASQAAEGIRINEDHFASQAYRKHLAKVFAKRALTAACA